MPTNMLLEITPAKLQWDENEVPYSAEFGDCYFSAENGLEETEHVFLDGNNLRERWRNLSPGDQFVIAETGFGSGLNLLAAARLWEELAPKSARLQFVSIEQFPMTRVDIERALKNWPELGSLAAKLIEQYPVLTPGYHQFGLTPNIQVTLIFDEIENGLASLCPPLEPELWDKRPYTVDSWFFDGFAPAKNPDMWGEPLYPLINRLSKTGTTFATFTAAGDVRRSLQKWGFEVLKTAGFGRKREMLVGELADEKPKGVASPKTPFKKPIPCWMLADTDLGARDKDKEVPIAIIGAGISGATLASALAKRGREVHVFDAGPKQSEQITRASDISQVALYARLSPDQGDLEDFGLASMTFSQRYYRDLFENAKSTEHSDLGDLCGLVQLPRSDSELKKMQRIADRLKSASEDFVRLESAENLGATSGVNIESSGLYFPNSGWLCGANVCHALLDHEQIDIRYESILRDISRCEDQWQLAFGGESHRSYTTVVFCSAIAARDLDPFSWLPTKPIRGQVSFFIPPAELSGLSKVVCRDIQLTPAFGGVMSTGSSYVLKDSKTSINESEHEANFSKLSQLIGSDTDVSAEFGQAQIRCTTPDYIPISGPAPDVELFQRRFARLRKDAKTRLPFAGPVHQGLFLNIGFGSRGYTYAPICAEHIASQICGELTALPNYLNKALHPARFLVRGLIRQTL